MHAQCPWYRHYAFNKEAADALEHEQRKAYDQAGQHPPVEAMKRIEPGMLLIAHPRASIDRSSDIFDVRLCPVAAAVLSVCSVQSSSL